MEAFAQMKAARGLSKSVGAGSINLLDWCASTIFYCLCAMLTRWLLYIYTHDIDSHIQNDLYTDLVSFCDHPEGVGCKCSSTQRRQRRQQ